MDTERQERKGWQQDSTMQGVEKMQLQQEIVREGRIILNWNAQVASTVVAPTL